MFSRAPARHARRLSLRPLIVMLAVSLVGGALVLGPSLPAMGRTSVRPVVDADYKGQTFPAGSIRLTGTAQDTDGTVVEVNVAVRDRTTGTWLQPDGRWANDRHRFAATLTPQGDQMTWSRAFTLDPGSYTTEIFAVDNDQQWAQRTGGWAGFDVTAPVAPEPVPPVVTVDLDPDHVFPSPDVVLSGTAQDTDGTVVEVNVAVRDRTTGTWLQPDGRWANDRHRFAATLTPQGDQMTWSRAFTLDPGSYTTEVFAVDDDQQWAQHAIGWVAFEVAPPVAPEAPAGRDPRMWPYPADSIWNHPLGDQARLVPFRMEIPTGKTLNVEEDIIIIGPDAPGQDVMKHDAAWKDGVTRCGSRTGQTLATGLPIPTGWYTDPGYHGRKPNHAAAILMPDMTLFETQPFHICEDGTPVSQFTNERWQGDSILTGGTGGDPDGGAHGGSFMTAFGGTIRLGEWVPGGQIRHALKLEVESAANLSPLNGGYRWPALRADAGYERGYGGSVPEARMGALVALPPDFETAQLQSEPARILAEALRRYGAYIVDGTGWSAAAFATEWGPAGRVKDEFQASWGFRLDGHKDRTSGPQHGFLTDMETIYAALHVVDDNGPASKGGAGTRLAPWAPPLDTSLS